MPPKPTSGLSADNVSNRVIRNLVCFCSITDASNALCRGVGRRKEQVGMGRESAVHEHVGCSSAVRRGSRLNALRIACEVATLQREASRNLILWPILQSGHEVWIGHKFAFESHASFRD